jgi:sarcosine oxidase
MTEVDVVVIGAGVAGSAATRDLAQRGREVLLLEQFEVGHKRGSSHGTSRIFRFSYDDPKFVRMAMDALPLWRELESEVGETLILTLGGIDCGKDIDAHVRALEECGADYELLSPSEVSERFPGLRVPEDRKSLYQKDAGIALADKAIRALVSSARAAGAEVRENCRVEALEIEGGRAVISTDGESYSARAAVVTAGAWAKALLETADIDLPVIPTRETVAYFHMEDELSVPSVVDWRELGSPHNVPGDEALYSLASPSVGIKAGEHHTGPVTDPDDEGSVDEESVQRISKWMAQRYPNADPEPIGAETCIYTNTSDERFLFERHGPIVVGSACSGHGFKFGPLTGRMIADLADQSE